MRDQTARGLRGRDERYLRAFADNPYQPEHLRRIALQELRERGERVGWQWTLSGWQRIQD